MSKKHYQAVATILYQQQPKTWNGRGSVPPEWDTWSGIVSELANMFAADNGRFDRGRFAEACETGTCHGMRKVAA